MDHSTATPSPAANLRVSRRALLGAAAAASAIPLLGKQAAARVRRQSGGVVSAGFLPRSQHTATALGDGRVLVTGGQYQGALADTRVLDGDIWRVVGSLQTPRHSHAAVSLPGGRVLVLGGVYQGVLADCEVFDPASETWSPAPPLAFPRSGHTATVVGEMVLVTGGECQGSVGEPEAYWP